MCPNFESELQSKSLKANFTEVQQVHFDKLMSELEQISGGLGFAELKKKAEGGDKDALQVMRDYIAKKEEVVEFIENKEFLEDGKEVELKPDDKVYFVDSKSGVWHVGTVKSNVITIEKTDYYNIEVEGDFVKKNRLELFKPSGVQVTTFARVPVELFEHREAHGLCVGQDLEFLNETISSNLVPDECAEIISFARVRGFVKPPHDVIKMKPRQFIKILFSVDYISDKGDKKTASFTVLKRNLHQYFNLQNKL